MVGSFQTLQTELEDGWLTIWFNQPDIRNALTDLMRDELQRVLAEVRDDRSVRGITLRGRGGVFCAGGDLRSFKQLASGDMSRAQAVAISSSIGELLKAVDTMPQVVVAVVEGAAIAGGLGLACSADLLLCQRDAKFSLTETAIGLSPAQIAPYIIQKLGPSNARRLMLTAARFNAGEACRYGFIDELCDDVAGLADVEAAIRRQVLGCAPGAIADTKRLLRDLGGNRDDSRVIGIAAENFADRVASVESAEGIAAFFDKRKPSWAGAE